MGMHVAMHVCTHGVWMAMRQWECLHLMPSVLTTDVQPSDLL
jgi:hypothetical protein